MPPAASYRAVGIVLAVYLVGLAIPQTRELFEDERVRGQSLAETLYDAFVRVPLGTVKGRMRIGLQKMRRALERSR